jgi:hypothetical protein
MRDRAIGLLAIAALTLLAIATGWLTDAGVLPLSAHGAFWFTIALFAGAALFTWMTGSWTAAVATAAFAVVILSNVHWRWTSNGYVAAFVGAGAALGIAFLRNVLSRRRQG